MNIPVCVNVACVLVFYCFNAASMYLFQEAGSDSDPMECEQASQPATDQPAVDDDETARLIPKASKLSINGFGDSASVDKAYDVCFFFP